MNEVAPPFISIVTPCLNRVETIGSAIASVLAQNGPSFEHIVVDGGSTDGTLDILARYKHVRVLSEPDRNLYDAINKGVRLATGQVVGLLNSDDVYAPGAFVAVAQAFATSTVEMVAGGAEIFAVVDGQETVLRRFTTPRAIGLSEANAIGNVTLINSCFWRRPLLLRMAPFDDRFPVAADKDFWMRLVIAQPEHVLLPRLLYRYLSHSGSLTFSGADTRERGSADLLNLARTRLAECRPGTPEHAAYRRWHAWAVGYSVLLHLLKRRPRNAMRVVSEGWALDAGWPLRFLWRLPTHWRDRKIRHGEL